MSGSLARVAITVLSLVSCAGLFPPPVDLSDPSAVAASTRAEYEPERARTALLGPAIDDGERRFLLRAWRRDRGGLEVDLYVTLRYRAFDWRDYYRAEAPSGEELRVSGLDKDFVDCRVHYVDDIPTGCAFTERVRVRLEPADLRDAVATGYSVTLHPRIGLAEDLDLPGAYLEGFLRRAENP